MSTLCFKVYGVLPSLQFAAPFAIAAFIRKRLHLQSNPSLLPRIFHKICRRIPIHTGTSLARNSHPQYQPPNLRLIAIGRMPLRITSLLQHLTQTTPSTVPTHPPQPLPGSPGPPPHQASRRPQPTHTDTPPPPAQDSSTDADTSSCSLHRNRQQPMAVAQLIIAQPRLLRAKQQRNPPTLSSQLLTNHPRCRPPGHASGCCNARSPTAVVPTTSVQSATASADTAERRRPRQHRPKHPPLTAPTQTAPHTRSPPADAEIQNHAWPAPPRRYYSDCAHAPAPRQLDRTLVHSSSYLILGAPRKSGRRKHPRPLTSSVPELLRS